MKSTFVMLKPGQKIDRDFVVSSRMTIMLFSKAWGPSQYLDGNHYTGSVQTIDSETMSKPGITGKNWTMAQSVLGTWVFLNQDKPNHCLVVGENGPALGRMASPETELDPYGSWLVYLNPETGSLTMRPYKGSWLICTEEGEVACDSMLDPSPRDQWYITPQI